MIDTRRIAKQKLETMGGVKRINTLKKRGGTNMYLDNDIVIDFPLPLSLQDDIKELDRDFSSGNDLHFALVLEIFEATAKQSYINGNITAEQLNLLFRRYGLR